MKWLHALCARTPPPPPRQTEEQQRVEADLQETSRRIERLTREKRLRELGRR